MKKIITKDFHKGFVVAWLIIRESLPVNQRLFISKTPPDLEDLQDYYFLKNVDHD